MENYKILIAWKACFLYSFLIVSTIGICTGLNAQSENFVLDSISAEAYFEKANAYNQKRELDSATVYFKKASQKFSDLKLWDKWSESQLQVCNSLFGKRKFNDLIDYLQYSNDHILPLTNNPMFIANINGWFGFVYYYKGAYDKALNHWLIEAKVLEELGHPDGFYGKLYNIGVIYTMHGDYEQALIYYKKAESIELEKQNSKELTGIYQNIGIAQWSIGDFDNALISYDKCLKFGGDEYILSKLISEVYRDKGALQRAMQFADKALNGFKERGYDINDILFLKGSIYNLQGKYDKAIEYYQSGLSSVKDSNKSQNREFGKAQIQLGNVHLKTNQLSLALTNYQQALSIFIPSFKEKDVLKNPTLEIIDLAFGLWIMEALIGKGVAFEKRYTLEGNSKNLELAVDCYNSAFKAIDILRYHYNETSSKTKLIEYAHPIYEKALHATLTLYKITDEEKYLNQAFVFSQKTKAFILASTLQNINAREQGGVPDSLIQKEEYLKKTILEAGQEIAIIKNISDEPTDSSTLKILVAERFEAKRNLQKLLDQLEKKYPQYYQLKYADEVASINDIRAQILDPHTALIDYFLGDSSLFILTITDKKADLQEVKRWDELDKAIATLSFQAGNANFTTDAETSYQNFTEASFFLFQNLLNKPLNFAGENISELILVLDGNLNKLPFEALLTEKTDKNKIDYSFSNLSYLIERYTISYHYAPQILLQQNKRLTNKNATNLFAGFAPTFSNDEFRTEARDCSESGLATLAYNQLEVQTIQEQTEGEIFLGVNATVQAFKTYSKDFRILHLATHACISEEDPLNHKIFFANEEFLTTSELFNLPLSADMVVLSACETGVGKIVKGEGVMSLARGFSYTGCPSVIMSLWSVPDKASADIMIDFYDNLKSGLSKDQSLRKAKLNFINEGKSTHHHPYYWAAFVPIGDSGPMSLGLSVPNWMKWFIGTVVLILLFTFFNKGRG